MGHSLRSVKTRPGSATLHGLAGTAGGAYIVFQGMGPCLGTQTLKAIATRDYTRKNRRVFQKAKHSALPGYRAFKPPTELSNAGKYVPVPICLGCTM